MLNAPKTEFSLKMEILEPSRHYVFYHRWFAHSVSSCMHLGLCRSASVFAAHVHVFQQHCFLLQGSSKVKISSLSFLSLACLPCPLQGHGGLPGLLCRRLMQCCKRCKASRGSLHCWRCACFLYFFFFSGESDFSAQGVVTHAVCVIRAERAPGSPIMQIPPINWSTAQWVHQK